MPGDVREEEMVAAIGDFTLETTYTSSNSVLSSVVALSSEGTSTLRAVAKATSTNVSSAPKEHPSSSLLFSEFGQECRWLLFITTG